MGTKWLLIALPLIVASVLAQSALWVPNYTSQDKGNAERLRTFVRASIGDAKILNPIINSNATGDEIMEDKLFEGLVNDDENLKIVPGLADRWETREDAY